MEKPDKPLGPSGHQAGRPERPPARRRQTLAPRRPDTADHVAIPVVATPTDLARASRESHPVESPEQRQRARSARNRYVAQLLARPAATRTSAPTAATFIDAAPSAAVINRTGLPDTLKSGLEQLGGVRLDDVRVHYDSPEPQRLNALAFTRGREIHVGPGQQAHLAHEGWHVVQQKQGRVRRTHWLDQLPVNNDAALEAEADRRGHQAQIHAAPAAPATSTAPAYAAAAPASGGGEGVVQGMWADQAAMTEAGLDPTRGVAQAIQALVAFVSRGGGLLTQDEKNSFAVVAQLYNDEAIRPRLEAFLGATFGPDSTWTSEALVRRVIEVAEDPEDDVDHDDEPDGTNVYEIRLQDIRWRDFSPGVLRERQILQGLFVEHILKNARGADQLGPQHIEPLFDKWYNSGVWTRAQVVREIRKVLEPDAEDDEPFVDARPRGGGPRRREPASHRMDPYGRPAGRTRGGDVVQAKRAADEIIQRKAKPNTVSFKAKYTTSLNGVFQNVGYMRDIKANIDFSNAQAHAARVWNDPSIAGSLVDLAQGSANPKRGMISATQTVKIAPGGTRGDHFQIANFLTGLNPGVNQRSSPTGKTWHHLTIAGYHMHLVDMLVHKKHCHVGGMNFWR